MIFLCISCNEDDPRAETVVMGKIINPNAEYVILENFKDVRDTVELDENGKFSITYQNLESGFYTFSHPFEYQSLYITSGDSIKMRLNTIGFDESLAFTGSRSLENNYLINLFTETEQTNQDLFNKYQSEPDAYFQFLDSITDYQIKRLKTYSTTKNLDSNFVDGLTKSIELNMYSQLERYPFRHFGMSHILKSANLPPKYTKHREKIDIKNPALFNLYSFKPYVNSVAGNIAFHNIAKSERKDNVDFKGYYHKLERLRVTDSLIENQKIKNLFAAKITRNFIRDNKNSSEIRPFVAEFLKISTDQSLNNSIQAMALRYEELEPGKKLADLSLLDINNSKVSLEDRVERLSVLFFWSDRFPDYAVRVHNKVKSLRIKYPEIDFIGINTDNKNQENWKKVSEKYGFNMNMEYMLEDFDNAEAYLELKGKNRTLIIEDDLTIVDPDINLFHYRIETTLLGYLSR